MSSVYYFVFLIVWGLAFEARIHSQAYFVDGNGRRIDIPRRKYVVFIAIVLILVSALRYYVGADFGAYYYHPGTWERLVAAVKTLDEPGICLLSYLAKKIYPCQNSLIVAASIFIVGLYVHTIYKYSPMFVVSILLYLFMGHWNGSFNGVRQYLAAAILFAGHHLIVERKFSRYCMVVMLAVLFHTTAAVMIVPYFLFNRKPDWRQLILLLLGAMVVLVSYHFVFDAISGYKGGEMDLTNPYLIREVNVFRIIVSFVPCVCYFMFCRKAEHTPEDDFYINGLLFYGFSMLAAMKSAYLARVGIYSGSMVVISWSHLFNLIDRDQCRRIVMAVVMAMYFVYWWYSIKVTGGRYNCVLFT